MQLDNPKYKNQYIGVDAVVFTLENKQIKVLLIKRKNAPFADCYALPGGLVYNNETIEQGMARELKEKTGITKPYLKQFAIFSDPKRDERGRIISAAFYALANKEKVGLLTETLKTKDAAWFNLAKLPKLAFDHKIIIKEAQKVLSPALFSSDIARNLMPKQFTLPELLAAYESLLQAPLDRRNFRKRFLNADLIAPTGKNESGQANRPAKYYKFK